MTTAGSRVRSVAEHTRTATDLVTIEIRRAVLTGVLAPGAPFSIKQLADNLGVSHIPVREALRRLEGQGLIVLRTGRSGEVAALTTNDMEAIYGLRLRIEPAIAAESVLRHTPQDVARLEQLLDVIRDGDADAAWEAHHDFHEGLCRPAATEWDLRVLDTLWSAANRYTRLVFDFADTDETERLRRYELHRLLLDAVLAGDPDAMRAELDRHLVGNQEGLRARIEFVTSVVVG